MYKGRTIGVIIPCRNEEDHLEKVVNKIPNIIDEIVIVSNKSSDNTLHRALELGLSAYEDNRTKNGIGYGYAHMTGIEKARVDIVVSMDGDGTYPIETSENIIDYFIDNDYDFISCNRYPPDKDTKILWALQLGVRVLNLEARILYNLKIKDILSGMWMFKKKIYPLLNLTEGDWNFSPQIKLNAFLNPKMKCSEYKIVQHQRYGQSKQNYLVTGLRHLSWIFANRWKMGKNQKQ